MSQAFKSFQKLKQDWLDDIFDRPIIENVDFHFQESIFDFMGNENSVENIQEHFSDEISFEVNPSENQTQKSQNSEQNSKNTDFSEKNAMLQKKKKLKKRKIKAKPESPFHNFPKHLFQVLKNLIKFPLSSKEDDSEECIAKELWQKFCNSNKHTKKALHFIFSQEWLGCSQWEFESYGIQGIYEFHGDERMQIVRNQLSRTIYVQLIQQNVIKYVYASKIKQKQKFIDYVIHFKKELQKGLVKKRMDCEENEEREKFSPMMINYINL